MAESSLVQSPFGIDDELPEVEQLFSQIPLLEDFEEVPEEASTKMSETCYWFQQSKENMFQKK